MKSTEITATEGLIKQQKRFIYVKAMGCTLFIKLVASRSAHPQKQVSQLCLLAEAELNHSAILPDRTTDKLDCSHAESIPLFSLHLSSGKSDVVTALP